MTRVGVALSRYPRGRCARPHRGPNHGVHQRRRHSGRNSPGRVARRARGRRRGLRAAQQGRRPGAGPYALQPAGWEYALTVAPDHEQVLDLLRGVDLYKVGHHGSRNATPRTLFNLWNEPATRDRTMTALMSTKTGVFPGTAGSHTEVPRDSLVTALRQRTSLSSTMDLQLGVTHVELAAPAFGDTPFAVVSSG
jgi:hypothetical protein